MPSIISGPFQKAYTTSIWKLASVFVISTMSTMTVAETTECTVINALPATIDSGGVYCLKSDLETAITSGTAISITANNVTFDGNGYKLGGKGGGTDSSAIGIGGQDRKNVTIRGANIRGFFNGVALTGNGSLGNRVENSSFDGNIQSAIVMSGAGVVIKGNRVYNTINNSGVAFGWVYAIDVSAQEAGTGTDAARVINNEINGIEGSEGWSGAIMAWTGGANAIILNNRISNMTSPSGVRGITVQAASGNLIKDNLLILPSSLSQSYGIYATSSSICTGNIVKNFADANLNCVDGGNNYFVDVPAAVPAAAGALTDEYFDAQLSY